MNTGRVYCDCFALDAIRKSEKNGEIKIITDQYDNFKLRKVRPSEKAKGEQNLELIKPLINRHDILFDTTAYKQMLHKLCKTLKTECKFRTKERKRQQCIMV